MMARITNPRQRPTESHSPFEGGKGDVYSPKVATITALIV